MLPLRFPLTGEVARSADRGVKEWSIKIDSSASPRNDKQALHLFCHSTQNIRHARFVIPSIARNLILTPSVARSSRHLPRKGAAKSLHVLLHLLSNQETQSHSYCYHFASPLRGKWRVAPIGVLRSGQSKEIPQLRLGMTNNLSRSFCHSEHREESRPLFLPFRAVYPQKTASTP